MILQTSLWKSFTMQFLPISSSLWKPWFRKNSLNCIVLVITNVRGNVIKLPTLNTNTLDFFTLTQSWQYFSSLFKRDNPYYLVRANQKKMDTNICSLTVFAKRDYLSRLQTLLVFLILNGTVKTKLAILSFLCCEEILKNSTGGHG